jgi:co-chaperonin GroES (HSP10)
LSAIHDGLIEIPETIEGKHSHQPGDFQDSFIGEVVAVGPGDRRVHGNCLVCGAAKLLIVSQWRGIGRGHGGFGLCGICGGVAWRITGESRAPMECKVGDRVIYARRPSAPGGDSDIEIDGERFIIFHEEQWAFALLED